MSALSTVTISPTGPTLTYFPVTTPEPWPPVILYGARPLSLDAAQIERDLATEEQDQDEYRLRVDCPTGNSSTTTRTPEEEDADDQCLSANLFPAEVYTRTPADSLRVYGGTYTPSGAPEKTWRCEMTRGADFGTLVAGDCSLWESSSGADAASTIMTEGVGRCSVSRMFVPVRLTAGAVEPGGWGTGGDYWFNPTNANNGFISALSSERCPDPTSLVGFEAATTTPPHSGTGTGTAGPSATGSASAAGAGRVSRGESAGPLALFCAVLACASVVGLLSIPL
ncbi:hypothetical protein Daus18300_003235 [Diaporthe australafricana]|uniref:Uncharacterized protein n=1 Tax=Diaporthe australafricana TaxID=127596 RepID=A0ABR3XHH5_9PEZI